MPRQPVDTDDGPEAQIRDMPLEDGEWLALRDAYRLWEQRWAESSSAKALNSKGELDVACVNAENAYLARVASTKEAVMRRVQVAVAKKSVTKRQP